MLQVTFKLALVQGPLPRLSLSQVAALAVLETLLGLAQVDFILPIDICNFMFLNSDRFYFIFITLFN